MSPLAHPDYFALIVDEARHQFQPQVIPLSTACAAETIAQQIRICRSELHDLARQATKFEDCRRLDRVLVELLEEFRAIRLVNQERYRQLLAVKD